MRQVVNPTDRRQRRKVLLVEDEAIIAMDLEQWLTEIGFEVVGPFRRNSDALGALVRTTVDLAVLDYLLVDGECRGVADRLERIGVPYVFLTGCRELHDGRGGVPVLGKPVSQQRLAEALASLCASAARCRDVG